MKGRIGILIAILSLASLSATPAPDPPPAKGARIARIFHGQVLTNKADEYDSYLSGGVDKLRKTPGSLGVTILRRADGDKTEFVVMSLWDSIESVKKYAGENYQKVVMLPRDHEFLVGEPSVLHYEVRREERQP